MKHKKETVIKKPKCACCNKDVPIEQTYNDGSEGIAICKECNKCAKCGAIVDVIKRFVPVKRGGGYEWERATPEPLCYEHYNEIRKEELKVADIIGKLPAVI
jgi:hypothetical protein